MITIYTKKCNPLSQKIYDDIIDNLQFHTLKCPCGCVGSLIRHGSYERNVKILSRYICLKIVRVMCEACHHTHALLLSVLVPYSQIPLKDQQEILLAYDSKTSLEPILEKNLLIDDNTVKYIIRQFSKHWKQRLAAISCSLKDGLTIPCFSHYMRQFMQIRNTNNILYFGNQHSLT